MIDQIVSQGTWCFDVVFFKHFEIEQYFFIIDETENLFDCSLQVSNSFFFVDFEYDISNLFFGNCDIVGSKCELFDEFGNKFKL